MRGLTIAIVIVFSVGCDGMVDTTDGGSPLDAARHDGQSCAATEQCTNGVDDDCDGLADCSDSDCHGPGSTCPRSFVGSCDGVSGRGGDPLYLNDIEVELSSGVARSTVPTSDGTIRLTISATRTGNADLAAAPNEYLATCTHCILVETNGHTYFPRAGTMALTSVPSAGGRLSGVVTAELEEVVVVGDEVQPAPSHACYRDEIHFDGAVSSASPNAGRMARPLEASEAAARATAEGSPPACGDNQCDNGEFGTCEHDCACGASQFTQACADGSRCPSGSSCVSRERCQCTSGVGVQCDLGARCDADPSACDGQNWSCIDVSTGCGNEVASRAVHCSSGGYCPSHSLCVDDGCDCEAGYEAVSCDGATCSETNRCSWPNWSCRLIPPQECGNGICESRETCSTCPSDCPCGGCSACLSNADCGGGVCLYRRCDGATACYTDINGSCPTISGVGSCPASDVYDSCTNSSDCGGRATCRTIGVLSSRPGRCTQACASNDDCTALPTDVDGSRRFCSSGQCYLDCSGPGATCPFDSVCQPFSDGSYGYCW